MYGLATQPRTVISEGIEGAANRYALAEALRAQGDEVGAARINAGQTSEIAAGILGLGQAAGGAARLGASGLRRMGAQDWNIVINDVPNFRGQGGAIGIGLERVGDAEAVAVGRMAELRTKWGDLTATERRTLLASKSEATWSDWLLQRDATAKAVNPNTHFLEKHGPDTTLLQQEIRASTKVAPDGSIDPAFRDSTRFLSARDMGAAMQRADSIFRLNGSVNRPYHFSMEGFVGEGYTKYPNVDWMLAKNVNAVFRNGQPYTVFPLLRPIQ
jgi:filamentous hemagglutinin